MRGWTWIDEDNADHYDCGDDTCEKCDNDSPEKIKREMKMQMIEKLASEWNDIHNQIERRGWRDDYERDCEDDYHSERIEELEDEAIYEAEQANPNLTKDEKHEIRLKVYEDYDKERRKEENKIYLKREAIEELMRDLGVRMMRPYEHWQEDERYMEYMETRYDNDYY